jgi:hypothetical protein
VLVVDKQHVQLTDETLEDGDNTGNVETTCKGVGKDLLNRAYWGGRVWVSGDGTAMDTAAARAHSRKNLAPKS